MSSWALMDFRDRIALVTGGTGALGSAVVHDLLTSGARGAATYTVEAEWQHLLTGAADSRSQLKGFPVDLTELCGSQGSGAVFT